MPNSSSDNPSFSPSNRDFKKAERIERIQTAETWVVKIGSRVLTNTNGSLDLDRISSIAQQIEFLLEKKRQVVLVSSGAVAAGCDQMRLQARPRDLPTLQAIAAIGQTHLIQSYENAFQQHERRAAQILLTAADLRDRQSYLNIRNTLCKLTDMQVVPIVNENDTVAVDELKTTFGDNDRLAALVAGLFDRPLLVMLSDVEGLYDRPPQKAGAVRFSVVNEINQGILNLASDKSPGSNQQGISKGGMLSKLKSARLANQQGAASIIASGRQQGALQQIYEGSDIGTLFLESPKAQTSRKRWLGSAAEPVGSVAIDAGAAKAIRRDGGSLLAIGIIDCSGTFSKGDVISIQHADVEIARGLTNYSSQQISQIAGQHSSEFESIIGDAAYEEVIHRNNLT